MGMDKATYVETEELLQEEKETTTEDSMARKVIKEMTDPLKMMVAEMEAKKHKCKTTRCSGVTQGEAQYCYYCQRKNAGLIEKSEINEECPLTTEF